MTKDNWPKIPHPGNVADHLYALRDVLLERKGRAAEAPSRLFLASSPIRAAQIMREENITAIDFRDAGGHTALTTQAGSGARGSVLEFFLENGADGNDQKNGFGNSPLLFAVSNAEIDRSLWLIRHAKKYHLNLDLKDRYPVTIAGERGFLGNTALTLAVAKGSMHRQKGTWSDSNQIHGPKMIVVIKALLENGADPNVADDRGNTAAHLAVLRRDLDALRLLRDAGADFSQPNSKGETPADLLTAPFYVARAAVDLQSGTKNTFPALDEWRSSQPTVAEIIGSPLPPRAPRRSRLEPMEPAP